MANKTPIYLRIKHAILENIHAGIWTSGVAIPAEITLAQNFGVSRMTVNRAIKELEAERILQRIQGSGTYVAQQKYNNVHIEIQNIANDIRSSHQRYHAQVLTLGSLNHEQLTTPENRWLAELFFGGTPSDDDRLYRVDIVHHGDDLPIQYEQRWVNAKLCADFIHQDFEKTNTSDYLISRVPLEYGDYQIQAVMPPHEVRTALLMTEGEPALLHTRHTKSQGMAVTFVNMWHAGSRFSFGGQL